VSESTVKKYAVLKIFNNLLKNQFRKSLIVNVKEIEKVLNDSNTSLSSIAASILLRICSEAYLETLFNRIEKTMSEMSIEYKKDVVRSLINVLKAYPKKYELINRFLLTLMKKEESCEIKSEAIEVMNFEITELGGAAKTECIKELTKFLSATQYHRIHFQILGIVSREAGQQDISSELFKNIISEIYLQEGAVRACGLSTLIKLAEYEDKQKEALEQTIQQFRNDSSL
jgi:coatomer protein complex subunit gamma